MKKIKNFYRKTSYASPNCKSVSLRTMRSVLTVSIDGKYATVGVAGEDGYYDPYNEDNDL